MKLGMMLEVDETFTMIRLSRSSEVRVKVRRWPLSPIGTIFLCSCAKWPYFCFQSKIGHHHHVPPPRFPKRCENLLV